MKERKYFGTDGVRGIVPSELSPEFAMKLGMATASYFLPQLETVVIGSDTRISSDCIKAAFISGLTSCGVDVYDAGVIPTPGISYLVQALSAGSGAVISASHNPFEYNGIKIFDKNGYKLSDEEEAGIESILEAGDFELVESHELGRWIQIEDAPERYAKYICSKIEGAPFKRKIAVDCANGATSVTAMILFDMLGVEAEFICTEPDGININRDCGATNPERLQALVRSKKLDGGFAFDGDGDRVVVGDENGKLLNGDQLIGYLSLYFKEKGILKKDVVVATQASNFSLQKFLEKNDLSLVRTDVGDRYVLEGMLREGAVIGGEESGHIILLDRARTGDGLMVAATILEALENKGQRFSDIRMFDLLPYVKVNVEVANKKAVEGNQEVFSAVKKAEALLGNSGRILIRPSGTEPVVRIMVEAEDESLASKIASELARTIERVCN